jgi:hypothetical protein
LKIRVPSGKTMSISLAIVLFVLIMASVIEQSSDPHGRLQRAENLQGHAAGQTHLCSGETANHVKAPNFNAMHRVVGAARDTLTAIARRLAV